MDIISFPKIFKNNSTSVITDPHISIAQSLKLLLNSELGSLFGDPGFGVRLKRYYFEQNNYVLKDILIDEIYTKICTFLPQIFVERKNIIILQKHSKIYVRISYMIKDSFEHNIYELVLFNSEESE